ncbi:MAG: Calx-beta domain-containing protein [Pirellulaceae bacterium]|nr:Calx-beta domain-containing protein [Pirellulaceae bacterium]
MFMRTWFKTLHQLIRAGRRPLPYLGCQSSGPSRSDFRLSGLESLEDRRLLTFNPAVDYSVGTNPQAIVTADFNGDGRLDIATSNNSSNTVSVVLSNANGTFQPALNSATGNNPLSLAFGDFNADGKLDIATANAADASVLLGNGNGTFQAPVSNDLSDSSSPSSVAVGDFNGDGNLDLGVVSNLYVFDGCGYYGCYSHYEGRANVLLGNGTGSFAAPITSQLGYGYHNSIAVADFNGDAVQDLASVNSDYGVNVLLGTGTGAFGTPVAFFAAYPFTLTAGDVNADGKTDLVTANIYADNVSVLLGNGLGSFGASQSYTAGSGPRSLALADFNGDGKIDLATANGRSGSISVLLGTGAGAFTQPVDVTAGAQSVGITVGDFNGDGRIDAASANQTSNSVSVLLNDAIWPALDAPSITIGDVTVNEGNVGSTTATFLVSLSSAYNQTVTVNYATADGTAIGGTDYQTKSGTLTFTPGQTSQAVSVSVTGDRIGETSETFSVLLMNATSAFISDGIATGTIQDNEPFLNLTGDATTTEGNNGTMPIVFTVTLSAPYDAPITVEYFTSDLTEDWIYYYGYASATAGIDYLASSGTLLFSVGQTSQSITVLVNGDRIGEMTEYFLFDIRNPVSANLGNLTVLGSIVDNEPTIRLEGGSVVEGNSGTKTLAFTAFLSAPYDLPVTVEYATGDGSAVAGSDYLATSGTLTFAAGQTIATIPVTIKGDLSVEYDEYFSMQLSNPINASSDYGSANGVVLDDDTPPSIYISGNGIYEGNSGTRLLTFTVSLSQVSSNTVQVNFATLNGTARTNDNDYTGTSGTLYFATGELTKTISVVIKGDTKREKNEYLYVRLTRPVNGTIVTAEAAGTILNDDGNAASRGLSYASAVDMAFEDLARERLKKRGK